jgi:hypothetical protein
MAALGSTESSAMDHHHHLDHLDQHHAAGKEEDHGLEFGQPLSALEQVPMFETESGSTNATSGMTSESATDDTPGYSSHGLDMHEHSHMDGSFHDEDHSQHLVEFPQHIQLPLHPHQPLGLALENTVDNHAERHLLPLQHQTDALHAFPSTMIHQRPLDGFIPMGTVPPQNLMADSAWPAPSSSSKMPLSRVKRSASTPNVRAKALLDAAQLANDKRRNKLGYHRTAVACGKFLSPNLQLNVIVLESSPVSG